MNVSSQTIRVYPRTASGNAAPTRTISGPLTGLIFAQDLAVDTTNNELIVVDTSTNSIRVFSRTASGNVAPLRTIVGAATGLVNPIGVYVDTVNNEIGVVNTFSTTPAVTVYSRTVSGNVAPLRTITGPATLLATPLRIALDTVNCEIFVTNRETAATGIPTLSEWGVIAMIALLIIGGLQALRRRSGAWSKA